MIAITPTTRGSTQACWYFDILLRKTSASDLAKDVEEVAGYIRLSRSSTFSTATATIPRSVECLSLARSCVYALRMLSSSFPARDGRLHSTKYERPSNSNSKSSNPSSLNPASEKCAASSSSTNLFRASLELWSSLDAARGPRKTSRSTPRGNEWERGASTSRRRSDQNLRHRSARSMCPARCCRARGAGLLASRRKSARRHIRKSFPAEFRRFEHQRFRTSAAR